MDNIDCLDFEKELDAISVKPLADRFYTYNYLDKRISFFFKPGLKPIFERMFSNFLIEILLGNNYNHKSMYAAHKKLGCIEEIHFLAFYENLIKALNDLKFSNKVILAVGEVVMSQKEEILAINDKELKPKESKSCPKTCCSIQ